ncbi:MAG TPA: TPM domain-containing protein [Candidatus Binatia bacterium]|nr:TPM domain-containing protein [Candidatus Binatia bacterium]
MPSTRATRSALALALVATALAGAAATEVAIPPPEGFVTDRAGVISAPVRTRLTALIEELRAKTGAEIAVVTVPTTAPLDDFTYALRVAEAWKPGHKGEDTGVVFLVAVQDRKLRVLVGYGLEGILPDGLVGEIEDEEVLPAFRAGRMDEGIFRGVAAFARRIAAARGVTLTGAPPAPPRPAPVPGVALLPLVVLLAVVLIAYLMGAGRRRRRSAFWLPGPGWGAGDDWFGGGSFGGGGAGRSW